MAAAATTPDKTPEWMLLLEKKKNRPHRLAHEIGAGAPCLACGDGCPGLDLHFWRKVCRNCKCKKEEHDVKDDDGYEQFEILLGAGGKRKKPGAFLKIKVPEVSNNAVVADKKGVPFDWVPPDVTDDVAAEYMRQLPAAKLPISGSDGALYRRQQLERQMPLHDLDAGRCHNLTAQEIEELQKYLDNLKSNVVGQGRVTKVPGLHSEQQHTYRGPSHELASSRPNTLLPTSHSYQSLPLPPLPNMHNAVPRPFQPHSGASDDLDLPPPLPSSNPPDFQGTNLKTPSSFMPAIGSIQSAQHSHDVAHSTNIAGQMYPNSSRAYGSHLTSQEGSLALHQNPETFEHSTDVAGQMYPSSSKAYGSHMTSPEGSLALHQHPERVAHSTDVAGHMHTNSPGAYGSHMTSHEGSLTLHQNPETFAHSTDVTGQMYPSSSKAYGSHMTSPEGSLALHQHPERITDSTNVPGHFYTNPPGAYGSHMTSHEGSLALHQQPQSIAHSTDVAGQMYPNSSKPFKRNSDGTYSSFPVDALPVSSQFSGNFAQSTDIPQRLVPGFSRPLASSGYESGSVASSQSRQHEPNTSNITNPAPGYAELRNSDRNNTALPIDGSIQANQNRYDVANSTSYDNLAPGLSRNQYVNAGASGKHVFPQDGSIQSSQNLYDNANSSNSNVSSDNQNNYGHPISTNKDPLSSSSQYRNNIPNPTGMQEHSTQGPYRPYQQYPGGPQQNESTPQHNLGSISRPISNVNPSTDLEGNTSSPDQPSPYYAQVPGAMRVERSSFRPGVVSSSDVLGDPMPRSAQIIHQSSPVDHDLASRLELLSAEEQPVVSHLNCKHCGEALIAGDVAVFADRAGTEVAWHPKCFVCNTCDELLVDLIYFFSKGNVYCGRHFAELLNIPRCFACDELIFVKEYTVAEGKTFHVKHFCCYECDDPLAGKQYIPADDQPTCIDCYQEIFGKRCNTCRKQIPAGHQRVGWKELNWHAEPECFRCFACSKSLLGGRFVMKDQQPFCDKQCVALIEKG